MNVLIACEESQTVCLAFRKKGHNAYSCDIVDCSGGYPEYHIKRDVLEVMKGGTFSCHLAVLHGTITRKTRGYQ